MRERLLKDSYDADCIMLEAIRVATNVRLHTTRFFCPVVFGLTYVTGQNALATLIARASFLMPLNLVTKP